MHILVVAATPQELAPLTAELHVTTPRPRLQMPSARYAGHDIDVFVAGVGMVATSANCSRVMAQTRYDLAFNFGVCGAFDRSLEPGTVVHVVSDRIAELGVEDDETFRTIQELQLVGENEFPFKDGRLLNAAPPPIQALSDLPAVSGISVNTAHGNERSIAAVVQRFNPQVESMEGAAFMYACLIHELPFAQVRAVSNIVEKRNRDAWKLDEAIRAVGDAALNILKQV